jgi:hypothetical protein
MNHTCSSSLSFRAQTSSLKSFHHLIIVALLISIFAPIYKGQAQTTNENITGVYVGYYQPTNSVNYNNFTLSIFEAPSGAVTALLVETNGGIGTIWGNSTDGFHTNGTTPYIRACSMMGRYDEPTKNLRLIPVKWETEDPGYTLKNVNGIYTPEAKRFIGAILIGGYDEYGNDRTGSLYASKDELLSAELQKQINSPEPAITQWGITLKLPTSSPGATNNQISPSALALTQGVPEAQTIFAYGGLNTFQGQTKMAVEVEVPDGDRGDFPLLSDLKSDIEDILRKNGVTIISPNDKMLYPTLHLHVRKVGYFIGVSSGTEYYFSLNYEQVFALQTPDASKKYAQVTTWVEDNLGMGGFMATIGNVRGGVKELTNDFIKDCLKADQGN